jgi:hypothetical protein
MEPFKHFYEYMDGVPSEVASVILSDIRATIDKAHDEYGVSRGEASAYACKAISECVVSYAGHDLDSLIGSLRYMADLYEKRRQPEGQGE